MASTLPPDPYHALGVSKDAKLAEIRSAHRKLVLKCHPDKVQDAALKAQKQDEFQKVQEAYEILSDDTRRLQYDEEVKLHELRREMGRGVPTARSNPFEYEVANAEPRSNTFDQRSSTFTYSRSKPKEASREPPKVYTQPKPKSYENVVYEEAGRKSKKSSGYESERKSRSSREDERLRDIRRQEEDERERARYESENRRAARTEKKKSRDKEKKRSTEEKYTRNAAYVEEDSSDEYRAPAPRAERKQSRHRDRGEEEIRMRSEETPRPAEKSRQAPLTPKWDVHKEYAAQYMEASRRKAAPADDGFRPRPLQRGETFAAPEQKFNIRYEVPQPTAFLHSDDDLPRRSSAPRASKRASDPPPSKKDSSKPSTKEKVREKEKEKEKDRRRSPRSRSRDPYIVEPPVSAKKPSLQTHTSAPPLIPGFMPKKEPSRSRTTDYPRKDPGPPPSLPRASTFQSGDHQDSRGSSRLKKSFEYTSESESDNPIYVGARPSASPPRRRDVREPEATRYIIDNGRSIPISRHRSEMRNIDDEVPYPRDRSVSPRGTASRSHHQNPVDRPTMMRNPESSSSRTVPIRAHTQAFYAPEAPEPVIMNARPKMPPRGSARGVSPGAFFGEVKYSDSYGPEHVVYNDAYPKRGDGYSSGHPISSARDYGYGSVPTRGAERVYVS